MERWINYMSDISVVSRGLRMSEQNDSSHAEKLLLECGGESLPESTDV